MSEPQNELEKLKKEAFDKRAAEVMGKYRKMNESDDAGRIVELQDELARLKSAPEASQYDQLFPKPPAKKGFFARIGERFSRSEQKPPEPVSEQSLRQEIAEQKARNLRVQAELMHRGRDAEEANRLRKQIIEMDKRKS